SELDLEAINESPPLLRLLRLSTTHVDRAPSRSIQAAPEHFRLLQPADDHVELVDLDLKGLRETIRVNGMCGTPNGRLLDDIDKSLADNFVESAATRLDIAPDDVALREQQQTVALEVG